MIFNTSQLCNRNTKPGLLDALHEYIVLPVKSRQEWANKHYIMYMIKIVFIYLKYFMFKLLYFALTLLYFADSFMLYSNIAAAYHFEIA